MTRGGLPGARGSGGAPARYSATWCCGCCVANRWTACLRTVRRALRDLPRARRRGREQGQFARPRASCLKRSARRARGRRCSWTLAKAASSSALAAPSIGRLVELLRPIHDAAPGLRSMRLPLADCGGRERSERLTGHGAEAVRDALTSAITSGGVDHECVGALAYSANALRAAGAGTPPPAGRGAGAAGAAAEAIGRCSCWRRFGPISRGPRSTAKAIARSTHGFGSWTGSASPARGCCASCGRTDCSPRTAGVRAPRRPTTGGSSPRRPT